MAGTGGAISPAGAVSVSDNSSQSFTITPDTGCCIVDVLVNGVSVGAVTSYEFTGVSTDHTITVSFAAITYTITASAGTGGAISPAGAVEVNESADKSFTITPDTSYHVDDVLVDGVSAGAVTSYEFIDVSTDHTITVSFTAITYTITASAGSGGTITQSGAVEVNKNADKSFTITPDTDYHIDDVLVDGVSVGAVTSYEFTGVSTGHTIEASFAATSIYNRPGLYEFEDLSCIIHLDSNEAEMSLTKVEVAPDGEMKFYITWTAKEFIGVGSVHIHSYEGLTKPYLRDDVGNNYYFTGLGGAASEEITYLYDAGDSCSGWFTFPPAEEGATSFGFLATHNPSGMIRGIVLTDGTPLEG